MIRGVDDGPDGLDDEAFDRMMGASRRKRPRKTYAPFTVHGVLAGAYRGKDIGERTLLTHASVDGGETALCRKVKAGALCDAVESGSPTCPLCAARVTP